MRRRGGACCWGRSQAAADLDRGRKNEGGGTRCWEEQISGGKQSGLQWGCRRGCGTVDGRRTRGGAEGRRRERVERGDGSGLWGGRRTGE
jgi:hypothetical protein